MCRIVPSLPAALHQHLRMLPLKSSQAGCPPPVPSRKCCCRRFWSCQWHSQSRADTPWHSQQLHTSVGLVCGEHRWHSCCELVQPCLSQQPWSLCHLLRSIFCKPAAGTGQLTHSHPRSVLSGWLSQGLFHHHRVSLQQTVFVVCRESPKHGGVSPQLKRCCAEKCLTGSRHLLTWCSPVPQLWVCHPGRFPVILSCLMSPQINFPAERESLFHHGV